MLDELAAILAADLPSQENAEKLCDVLYSRCYARSILDQWRPLPHGRGSVAGGDSQADLTDVLAGANRSRAQWNEGWTITQALDDGRVVARKNGAERAFQPGEYLTHRGPDLRPKKGSAITVYAPAGSSEIQDAFYYAFGETVAEHQPQRVLRFYWNVRPEGVGRLMETLTRELNRFQVPFRFKCLNRTSSFPRRDAAVLYVDARYYAITAMLAERIHGEVGEWLGSGTPLFAKRLAAGLGFAEDPGDSFGKHRCRILAGAMAASCGKGVEERISEVRRAFAERGLSLDLSWLNAGSAGEYPFGEGVF